jgi:hypothetical protein
MLFVKTLLLAVLSFGALSMAAPIDNTADVSTTTTTAADIADG